MSWPDELAEALGEQPMSDDEVAEILDVARDVAHSTERRYAPLSTFLLGLAVARGHGSRDERLAALSEQTRHLLGIDAEAEGE